EELARFAKMSQREALGECVAHRSEQPAGLGAASLLHQPAHKARRRLELERASAELLRQIERSAIAGGHVVRVPAARRPQVTARAQERDEMEGLMRSLGLLEAFRDVLQRLLDAPHRRLRVRHQDQLARTPENGAGSSMRGQRRLELHERVLATSLLEQGPGSESLADRELIGEAFLAGDLLGLAEMADGLRRLVAVEMRDR